MPLQKHMSLKTAAIIDGGLLRDTVQMKLDMSSTVLFEAITIKNCFVECGFSICHVNSNGDSVVKPRQDVEDDWRADYSLFKCCLRTAQHVTVLLRFVGSRESAR
jgi:hypothetical protein